MLNSDLEALISYGEDSRIEYKKMLRLDTTWHKVEFIKDVMALANKHDPNSAHLLIGVDNDGVLHDLPDTFPDEAILQQLVLSHIDPPILFALSHYVFRDKKIVVLTIPPSRERFHVAAKDVFGPDGKPLLRQGESYIRRGTAKVPLRGLDFKMLKEAYAVEQTPQAVLDVCFRGGERELAVPKGSLRPAQVTFWLLTHLLVPRPAEQAGLGYQFVPMRFFIHNRGQHQAENVVVEVGFSDNCQAIVSFPDERNPYAWQTSVSRRTNRVRIEGRQLVHGDYHWSQDIYVRVFQGEPHRVLDWTARAGNVVKSTSGTVHLKTFSSHPL